ncbi:MAG: hypothetical protein JWM63_3784 [Gammaproteobacteria bacterium]|jgi:hypothetical protein|nr:hypothetical protein [Gammaproteobacteria bacterium]
MREVLQGDDLPAPREALRQLIDRCHPAKDGHVTVELTTRHVLLATGTADFANRGVRRVQYPNP